MRPTSQASDETTVFVIQPDGWYGLLSLRSPMIRRAPVPGVAWTPDWDDWIRRMCGSGAVERVSCVANMSCWMGTMFLTDPDPNGYADHMLRTLSTKPKPIFGTAVFTGYVWGNGTTVGLDNDQLQSVASGYRMAQQKLLASI